MKAKLTREQKVVRNQLLRTFASTDDSRLRRVTTYHSDDPGATVIGYYAQGPTGYYLIYWQVHSRSAPSKPWIIGDKHKVHPNEIKPTGSLAHYRDSV